VLHDQISISTSSILIVDNARQLNVLQIDVRHVGWSVVWGTGHLQPQMNHFTRLSQGKERLAKSSDSDRCMEGTNKDVFDQISRKSAAPS